MSYADYCTGDEGREFCAGSVKCQSCGERLNGAYIYDNDLVECPKCGEPINGKMETH